ncbi:MAG: hypothetical protein ABI359_14800, partial [Ginsengibacter sp.]
MRWRNILLPATFFFLIFLLGLSTLIAQKKMEDYSSQWNKVENLQKKGLTKSALQEVGNIYRNAKKNGNEPQIIKALLFKINLKQDIEEDASVKAIDSVENEIASSKEP